MILCDTNILIDFFKGNETVTNEIRQIGFAELAVSVITTGELYYDARDKAELAKIQKRLALLKQVELDPETSIIFMELMGKYVLSHRLSLPDALIAATALRHDASLYTFNLKDFKYIPGIKLYQA
jgi:Predicted nucleic acid-binding protein, contains PIN domain